MLICCFAHAQHLACAHLTDTLSNNTFATHLSIYIFYIFIATHGRSMNQIIKQDAARHTDESHTIKNRIAWFMVTVHREITRFNCSFIVAHHVV